MKLPGPDHPITITVNPKRVRALYQGHVIAESNHALALKEATYPVVQYFPREDVAMMYLSRTDHGSHCPYKGDASYYSIARDGQIAENAVWSYEEPYPAMAEIKDYLAFYPNRVEIQEVDDRVPPEVIRDVVEHTDSGSGTSQLERWPANVDDPLKTPVDVERPYKDTGSL
jgi:uncharacterized protein (DUF427 family)